MFLKGSTWESRDVVVFSVAHISECSVSLIDNVTKHRSSRMLLIVSEAANKQQRKAS